MGGGRHVSLYSPFTIWAAGSRVALSTSFVVLIGIMVSVGERINARPNWGGKFLSPRAGASGKQLIALYLLTYAC